MVNNNLRTLETLFTESIGDNNLKKIIIPKIQRSYAQGRKEEVQVREGILQELFSTLKEGKDIELFKRKCQLRIARWTTTHHYFILVIPLSLFTRKWCITLLVQKLFILRDT